ncbi:hypothetical protein DQ384_14655 [Sphaerisporangium album]|uniref:Uncharacterized protein n=1 Tax=Sphaerisporangium album TaxID=509200 RepID=A0A367FJS3_9ACTN|nr:hypothetical protein [Sphaerisporangium album]RCG30544.1 hypothetical protein DQ384_14655 [Sphaerisporangium album]
MSRAGEPAAWTRRERWWHVGSVFLLGLAMLVLTLAYGLLMDGPAQSTTFVVLLIPLLVLVIYTARRPAVPRHHRTLYSSVTPIGAVLYAITVVFGRVFFPSALWWWVPGAILCALPFFLVGLLNLRAAGEGVTPPAGAGRGPRG